MRVKDLMSVEVVTVRPDATFGEVASTLLKHHISGAPVVDDEGTLVGIVTEADLMSKEAMKDKAHRRPLAALVDIVGGEHRWATKAEGRLARDVMTPTVAVADPDESVHAATRRMLDAGYRRLPVVRDGQIVGILARGDVIGVFHRTDEALRDAIETLLRRCLYAPPEDDIKVIASDGVIELYGEVRYESDVRVVGAIVASAEGVVEVRNDLRFRERDPEAPERGARR